MIMILMHEYWPTVAMCSCLPLDATPVNPILFALQIVSRKLLLKPLKQMPWTSRMLVLKMRTELILIC